MALSTDSDRVFWGDHCIDTGRAHINAAPSTQAIALSFFIAISLCGYLVN
jgi:hypothetical protein